MESLAVRKLNYEKTNFYGQLKTYLFYGICRIDNIEVEEFTGALKELGVDNFKIDKDSDTKVFVIEVRA